MIDSRKIAETRAVERKDRGLEERKTVALEHIADSLEAMCADANGFQSSRADDPFRGCFEDGNPRDPSSPWYRDEPMPAERVGQALTEILKERGVTAYQIDVKLVGRPVFEGVNVEDIVEDLGNP